MSYFNESLTYRFNLSKLNTESLTNDEIFYYTSFFFLIHLVLNFAMFSKTAFLEVTKSCHWYLHQALSRISSMILLFKGVGVFFMMWSIDINSLAAYIIERKTQIQAQKLIWRNKEKGEDNSSFFMWRAKVSMYFFVGTNFLSVYWIKISTK